LQHKIANFHPLASYSSLLRTCRSNDQAVALLSNAFDLRRFSIEVRIATTEVNGVDTAFKALLPRGKWCYLVI